LKLFDLKIGDEILSFKPLTILDCEGDFESILRDVAEGNFSIGDDVVEVLIERLLEFSHSKSFNFEIDFAVNDLKFKNSRCEVVFYSKKPLKVELKCNARKGEYFAISVVPYVVRVIADIRWDEDFLEHFCKRIASYFYEAVNPINMLYVVDYFDYNGVRDKIECILRELKNDFLSSLLKDVLSAVVPAKSPLEFEKGDMVLITDHSCKYVFKLVDEVIKAVNKGVNVVWQTHCPVVIEEITKRSTSKLRRLGYRKRDLIQSESVQVITCSKRLKKR